MGLNIKNAFRTKTRAGHSVFRIKIDNDEVLSALEKGDTHIAIDICTDKYGNPSIYKGNGKKGAYCAMSYYTWSMKPKGDKNEANETEQNTVVANS